MISESFPDEIYSMDNIVLDARLHRPGSASRGCVLLVHGITADLEEGGMFARLGDALAGRGFTVGRFSFRGHGGSGGTQRGVTISGELLDLEAAVEWLRGQSQGSLALVAASFGAVSVLSSMRWLESELAGLALWNPVLDLRRTFLQPELPWGAENFGPAELERLWAEGSLVVDGEFVLGRALFTEFGVYDPARFFVDSVMPALVVHGDEDTFVSYNIAWAAAQKRAAGCGFHTVAGSDHGFDSREREDEAIGVTVAWLDRLFEEL